MGLGHVDDVSLAEARNKADAARRLIKSGTDPLAERNAGRVAAIAAQARATTFAAVAERYIAAQEAGWKNPKHRAQWRSTLSTYAEPVIGALPIEAVNTDLVLQILEPIWQIKPETATRLRGRLEMVLSYAIARGWRDGPNPAVWRGHLQLMLPARAKVRAIEHHAALDWREVPGFMGLLRQQDGIGALALQFTILTAARSGEVRGATWDEIDVDKAMWNIPAARMKAGRAHRVPLSASALAVLQSMRLLQAEGGIVFPGRDLKQPLSDMSLTAVLRRIGRSDLTAHGFRSTFRDWAAEATSHPNHVIEQALSHAIGDKVEAAYRRGDLFAKRALMEDWANYLARRAAKVVRLRKPAVADDAERTIGKRTSGK
jgi:integrase